MNAPRPVKANENRVRIFYADHDGETTSVWVQASVANGKAVLTGFDHSWLAIGAAIESRAFKGVVESIDQSGVTLHLE